MLELYQHPGCSGWLGGVSGHEHPAPISWEPTQAQVEAETCGEEGSWWPFPSAKPAQGG